MPTASAACRSNPAARTELETANTPNLDALARTGVCGVSIPVLPGITPGSGPGHLGLFGYDPLEYLIGRGVLEATGIDFEVGPRDVAIRGNFCTIDAKGNITDRRAGRPNTDRCTAHGRKNCADSRFPASKSSSSRCANIDSSSCSAATGLRRQVNDTDPQVTGVPPLVSQARILRRPRPPNRQRSSSPRPTKVLKSESPTNCVTLRGFARRPKLGAIKEVYGLRAAAIAVYPMYKGLARLVGMDIIGRPDARRANGNAEQDWDQVRFLLHALQVHRQHRRRRQLRRQSEMIEEFDAAMPAITALKPDVLIVTGDHARRACSQPQLAPGADAPERGDMSARRRIGIRRESLPPRRIGPVRGEVPHALALAHARRLAKYGA